MDKTIPARVHAMRSRAAERDGRMQDVFDVRNGETARILPGMFPEIWPKPIVANFVDTVARTLAEVTGGVPAINCESALQVSARAKRFAGKRTKIAHYYFDNSNLTLHLVAGADRYYTYGFIPFVVEPNFTEKMPQIVVDDPMGTYYHLDIRGNVVQYVKVWRETALELAGKFPDLRDQILNDQRPPRSGMGDQHELEVIRYIDRDVQILYLPERKDLVLVEVPNRLRRVPVAIAERPGLDNQVRGAFDDVMWVQLARARMALLGLEAVEKSVGAPLAVPQDVQQMPFGPDAILRSSSPEKIKRVGVDLPQSAVVENQMLLNDMREGARVPQSMVGSIDASVITGRGIQELQGGFDQQVKVAQTVIGYALQGALSMALEMDQTYWPKAKKMIRGVANGTHFEESYVPETDINGNYTVDVTYGFAAGMDPNRALVFLLQLRADKLIPRRLVQTQLPMEIDVEQVQQEVDIEMLEDGLKQGILAMLASMGIAMQNGQDPVALLRATNKLAQLREKGMSLRDAVEEAFAPQTPPPGPQNPGEVSAAAGAVPGQGAGLPPGMQASGTPFGVAQGQAEMGPGGRPDMQTLLASLGAGGQANLSAGVTRRLPA